MEGLWNLNHRLHIMISNTSNNGKYDHTHTHAHTMNLRVVTVDWPMDLRVVWKVGPCFSSYPASLEWFKSDWDSTAWQNPKIVYGSCLVMSWRCIWGECNLVAYPYLHTYKHFLVNMQPKKIYIVSHRWSANLLRQEVRFAQKWVCMCTNATTCTHIKNSTICTGTKRFLQHKCASTPLEA